MKKSEFCEIFSRNLWQKKSMKIADKIFVFKRKISNIFLKKFIKVYESKIPKNGEWNQRNSLYFLESLNLDISLSKTKIKKIFLIPYSALDKLSNDTSLNSLRWIYRSVKIDWTKKPIWVYSSPPPLKRGRNNELCWAVVNEATSMRRGVNDLSFGAGGLTLKNLSVFLDSVALKVLKVWNWVRVTLPVWGPRRKQVCPDRRWTHEGGVVRSKLHSLETSKDARKSEHERTKDWWTHESLDMNARKSGERTKVWT